MSILYQVRVLSSENKVIPSEELYELHTDSSRKNLQFELSRLQMDTWEEEKIIRFQKFKEILADNLKSEHDFFKAFACLPDRNKDAIADIEENYELNRAKRLFSCESFTFHQLLSEIFPGKFTLLPATEVILEVVSVHPDAGYPVKRRNDRVLSNDNKKFALRLLSDIYDVIDRKNNIIYNWFDAEKKGSFYALDLPGYEKILWGIEMIQSIIIKPSSKAFWKKHENVWWKPIYDDYGESDNQPYEYRKLRTILPLGWFPEISSETQSFYSVAFWI